MPIADRTTEGPALSSRLAGRADRVPVAGGSAGFRTRFGFGEVGARVQAVASRLFDRAEGFFSAHGSHRLGALGRMWPEERSQRAPWDRGGLYRGEMVLPERIVGEDEDLQEEQGLPGPAGKKVFVPHRPVASPWGKSLDAPARVVRGSKTAGGASTEPRARDIVRKGLPASTARMRKTARVASERMIPVRTRALDRAAQRVDETSLLPAAGALPQGRVSRSDTPSGTARSRPVAPPRSALARLTRAARTRALPDRAVSAVDQAASRAAGPGRSRGLRPVLGNSPSVEAVLRSAATVAVSEPTDAQTSASADAGAPVASSRARTTAGGAAAPAPRPARVGQASTASAPAPAARSRSGAGPSVLDVAGASGAVSQRAATVTPTARAVARQEGAVGGETPGGAPEYRVGAAQTREGGVERAAARGDDPSTPQTAARPVVAAGALARSAQGGVGARAVSPRRFAVRKMASGVFGPDRVVVAPPVPEPTEEAAAPPVRRRHPGAPPPVVSGFGSAGAGVASTARVSRTQASVPAAVLDAQAPSAHASRRLERAGTATSRSVLPRLPSSSVAASGTSAGSASPGRRSPVHRAADRARAAASRAGSLVPSPVGAVVNRAQARAQRSTAGAAADAGSADAQSSRAALRAGNRGVQRRAVGAGVDTSSVVQSAHADGAVPAEASGVEQGPVGSAARTQRGSLASPSERAAARAEGAAAGLGSVRRVLGLSESASEEALSLPRSRFSRSGPVSYARRGRAPLVRIEEGTAAALGLFSTATQDRETGEWLVEGDLASAVQRAASREAASAAARDAAPRSSTLRYASPQAQTVAPGLGGTDGPAAVAPGSPGFAGAPVVSGWGTSPGVASSPAALAGAGVPATGGVRVQTTRASRPLAAADARAGSRTSVAPVGSRRSTGRASSSRSGAVARSAAVPARPMLGSASAQRTGLSRRSAVGAPEALLPQPAALGLASEAAEGAGETGPRAVASSMAFQPGMPTASTAAQPASGLSGLLQEVERGASDAHLPVWARRASGRPLVTGTPGGLVSALSRASSEEDVVRVLVEEGRDVVTASTLPKPVTEVIKQIRSEATAQVRDAQVQAERELSEAGAPRSEQVARRQASARVIRNMNTLRGRSRTQSGVGPDQVSRLAKKLQGLIHLAEGVGDRDAARRQVRMAEDSAAARAEGQGGDSTRPDTGLQDQVDIDALSREVLEAVSRELELRRERRQEDSDGSFWW